VLDTSHVLHSKFLPRVPNRPKTGAQVRWENRAHREMEKVSEHQYSKGTATHLPLRPFQVFLALLQLAIQLQDCSSDRPVLLQELRRLGLWQCNKSKSQRFSGSGLRMR